jgi:ubiquinone/menaquinone biosynthesis C-methylase UbiE
MATEESSEEELIQVSFTVKDAQELFAHLAYCKDETVTPASIEQHQRWRGAIVEALAARSEKAV